MYKIVSQHSCVTYVTRKHAFADFHATLWACVLLDRKGRVVCHK